MAQAGTARIPSLADGDRLAGLTEKDSYEIGQYEKIVQLRDTVLSGKHPTIKLPPGLKAIADSLPARVKTTSVADVRSAVSRDQQAVPENFQAKVVEVDAPPVAEKPVPSQVASRPAQRPLTSGRTEINPILLEKSDELIRAEFQLQRQRLERSLRDELEERRGSKPPQSSFVVFDLSDVLTKALQLVEATALPLPADEDLTANHEAASDSLDDDTFYSSHHDTPESNLTSRLRNLSEAPHLVGVSSSRKPSPARIPVPRGNEPTSPVQEARRDALARPVCQPGPQANPTVGRSGGIVVPGLNNYVDGIGVGPSARRGPAAGREASRTGVPGPKERAPPPPIPQSANASAPNTRPPSPLTRPQDHLTSAAPSHTAQDIPMAVDNQPIVIASGPVTAVPTPAPVATTRHEPASIISDTSSQGEKDHEKKKGKRKKRKADRQAPETEGGAYIKTEPRSASPITAPSYARPGKRQRQAENQPAEPEMIDPGYARPSANGTYDPHHPHIYRQERVPVIYEEPTAYPRRVINTTSVIGEPRYEREYVDEYQVPGGAYVRRHPSPGGPSYHYSPREAHPTRSVTQVIVNDPYREPPRLYRESLERPRMSVRPEGDPFVVPPRPPPARIVVDAYGREYIEPPHPVPRHSVAPPGRPGEPEIVYERLPSRAMSGHPGAGPYDDGGIVYARPPPPPPFAVTRRYVAQPEYITHEYHRDTRAHDREYSTQPLGPREYVRVMTPQDRRPVEERPREYITRVANVRPLDAPRYEAPQLGYGRMQSARPEAPAREHAGSVHPESRHAEGAPGFAGEYGSGPVLQQQQQPQQQPLQQQQQQQPQPQPYVRRAYSVRPAERYNEPAHGGRRGEEIAFIEGPGRRTQEIVYVDDGRREVYRP